MPFIDRDDDLEDLNSRWGMKPQIYLLWGRRRVGKSALIREFAAGKDAIIYQAIRGTATDQLQLLTRRILARMPDPVLEAAPLANWDQAFAYLEGVGRNRKAAGRPLILVFDELQYLAATDDSIVSRLQDFLETVKHSDLPLFVILSGSSISFFERHVAVGTLFGRRTGGGLLAPLGYADAGRFFLGWSAVDRIRAWGVLGGMPYYLEQFNPARPLSWNIRELMLHRNQVLYNEAELLLTEELRDAPQYLSVLAAVAGGATRLSEISARTSIQVTSLPQILNRLARLHLVERTAPLGEDPEKSKRGLWTLLDNYLRFWFTFVRPNLVDLEAGRAEAIWKQEVAPRLDAFISKPAFERACREWLRTNLGQHSQLPARGEVGAWWGPSTEMTASGLRTIQREAEVVVRTGSDVVLVGEAKWAEAEVGAGALSQLRTTVAAMPATSADTRLVLFARQGFSKHLRDVAATQGIVLVTAADMFRTTAAATGAAVR